MTSRRWHLALAVLLAGLGLASGSEARPWRGDIPVELFLCEPSDPGRDLSGLVGHAGSPPYPRPTPDQLRDRLFGKGGWSVGDFVASWSFGLARLGPVTVFGWETLPLSRDRWLALGRPGTFERCVRAFAGRPGVGAQGPRTIRLVVGHPFIDLYGRPGARSAFVPQDVDSGAAAHEIFHALGLEHSWNALHPELPSPSPAPPAFGPASRVAEYGDPWDVMSWANQHPVPTGNGPGPAGVNAPHLDWLGWLPVTRIANHGADGRLKARWCLAPLDEPTQPGFLAVRVPLDPGDPFSYLSIEHRSRTGWGAGVPAAIGDTIRIHRVGRAGAALRTTLIFTGPEPPPGAPWTPATLFATDGVVVRTLRNAAAGGCSAEVEVEDRRAHGPAALAALARPRGPNVCAAGLEPRGLDPFDHVCVPPVARWIHHQSGSRWLGVGPTGALPDPVAGCPAGSVARNAFSGDDICVPPAERDAAARDNADAASRFLLR